MALKDDILDLVEHENAEAQTLLKSLTEAMPNSVDAHALYAVSLLRRLQFDEAIAAFRRVVELEPKHDEALHNVAFCLLNLGRYQEAFDAYNLTFSRLSTEGSLRMAALLLHRLGRLPESVNAYRRLLQRGNPSAPGRPAAIQGYVSVLRDSGQVLEADHMSRMLRDLFAKAPVNISSTLIGSNNAEDFFEWSNYVDKGQLGVALMKRRAVDPEGARVPATYLLPQDRAALEAYAAGPDAPPLYIVKPVRSSGGQGISVTNNIADALDRDDVVVQRYIERPYLVNGRKGHMRIYGYITSVDPVRAYVYGEGIVRFAPETYSFSADEVGGVARHITNTALHLDHPDLVISTDPNEENVGLVWSLSAYLNQVAADGHDRDKVFADIGSLVSWYIRMLQADGVFARQAASHPRRAFMPKLFGLDVLLDADAKPWLIEMQRVPAMRGQVLVEKVNAGLSENVFKMVNGPLLDERMTPDQIARILKDPEAVKARELEIERANLGRFTPLEI